MIYMDNASTTQVSPEVLVAMLPYFTERYGNAGNIHTMGLEAERAVEEARCAVAKPVNADANNIIFTSGGSEANSLAIVGLLPYLKKIGKMHIITSTIEHHSVLESMRHAISEGFEVTFIPPTVGGMTDMEQIKNAMRKDTGLMSFMYINNEIGSANNIEEIGNLCYENSILFHTDCVQAYCKKEINVNKMHVDFLSVSGHKIHAPKGIGFLYARNKYLLQPIIHGSKSQEFGLRGGTENVPYIVGFGEASKHNNSWDFRCGVKASEMRDALTMKLRSAGIAFHINGYPDFYSRIINLRFDDVDGETLLLMLNSKGLLVSAGSACSAHEAKPSHVLTEIGLSDSEARSSVRFSFSEYTTKSEVQEAAEIVAESIKQLLAAKE